MARIVAGLSGGVDSAVAAGLLKAAGHEVIGVTLRTWASGSSRCCEIDAARETARRLGIHYHIINCVSGFENEVKAPFLSDRLRGVTPNPCVACNRAVKWKWLLYAADLFQADAVASGHYASVVRTESGRCAVQAGADRKKDQSYMLCRLTQAQLQRTILPLGAYTKREVRAIASSLRLPSAEIPDSQELCFITDGHYADYLAAHTAALPERGDFVDENGAVLGAHGGIHRYTIGQRRGLGIASAGRLYVNRICAETNTVVLGDAASLLRREIRCGAVEWMGMAPPEPGEALYVRIQIRAHHTPAEGTVFCERPGAVRIRFDGPVRAPAPGQYAVLYDEHSRILGSGIME
ncbi:MAG: tRNA 2-thiouridine(34) synthase MnmA [Oscillospiraceae bacterium]|nr:tRNA 2-thiouridine(34) synthase MnmA [Oscillospiraceae bacterium]MBQ6402842.1 tRNA 2-thiouridine(34) synthase MnmA [Oscillospiraceae bacterium]